MYVADLATDSPIARGPWVRAVGWLAKASPGARGPSPPDFVERLRVLCDRSSESAEALNWPVSAGLHACDFCEAYHSGGNIGVPDGHLLFVAPDMIAHYVSQHGYAPPRAFVEAVLRCPMPGTPEYAKAVRGFVPE
jgi:hypothetical protein